MKVPNPMKINMVKAIKGFEMKVTVKHTHIIERKVRLAIGVWLIKLASFIVNTTLVINREG